MLSVERYKETLAFFDEKEIDLPDEIKEKYSDFAEIVGIERIQFIILMRRKLT